MKLKLKHKLIGLPLLAGILPVLVMFILIYIEKGNVKEEIEDELDVLGRESMERLALAVHDTCFNFRFIVLLRKAGQYLCRSDRIIIT